jgi:hypothetical protein
MSHHGPAADAHCLLPPAGDMVTSDEALPFSLEGLEAALRLDLQLTYLYNVHGVDYYAGGRPPGCGRAVSLSAACCTLCCVPVFAVCALASGGGKVVSRRYNIVALESCMRKSQLKPGAGVAAGGVAGPV